MEEGALLWQEGTWETTLQTHLSKADRGREALLPSRLLVSCWHLPLPGNLKDDSQGWVPTMQPPSQGPPPPYLSLYQPANTLGNTPWAFFINKLISKQNLTKMTPRSVNLLEGRQTSLQPWSWVHFYDHTITEVCRLETANSKRKVALQFDWLAVRAVNT